MKNLTKKNAAGCREVAHEHRRFMLRMIQMVLLLQLKAA
jgi:hypothetical protein